MASSVTVSYTNIDFKDFLKGYYDKNVNFPFSELYFVSSLPAAHLNVYRTNTMFSNLEHIFK